MCNKIERRINEIQTIISMGLKENDPATYNAYKKELEELLELQNREIEL